MIDSKDDGVSHINVYSKGRTDLGRYLTNFGDCDIETEDGPFRTVEGYWYWISCGDDRLRSTSGWESKKLGRTLRAEDWPKTPGFQEKISKAIMLKMMKPWCVDQLIQSGTKPFFHYYVYGPRVIMVKDGLWMLSLITEFRDELVKNDSK